jgi:hypothetical protein
MEVINSGLFNYEQCSTLQLFLLWDSPSGEYSALQQSLLL